MDIVLIRHGESDANVEKIYGGREVKLTEKGYKQGILTKPHIQKSIEGKKIFVSPYKRAISTMESLGLKGEIEESIGEIDFGVVLGKTYKEILKENPDIAKGWDEDPIGYRVPKGESIQDGYDRISNFLNKKIEQDEDIVLICHDGVIRLALCYVFDNPNYFYRFRSDNLGVSKIRINQGYKYINYMNRVYYSKKQL